MFGFACNETPELMPLPIALAHRIINRITDLRKNGTIKWLRPDSKSQVTVEYEGYTPIRIDTVVVSTQHHPDVTHAEIVERIKKEVIDPVLPSELVDGSITYHINPTGKFVIGGPHGDSGVTGRKIIVDTYGGTGRHGGGAFSGKDPTKVDRSAAYMARYVAKNIVASQACRTMRDPVGLCDRRLRAGQRARRYTGNRNACPTRSIAELVRRHFRLNPSGIIKQLDLRRPIYRKTASGGHFGRSEPEFTWEKTDKAQPPARGRQHLRTRSLA